MPVKKIVKKFNYSKKDLAELVLKIDDYKFFLPWCINSKILTIDKNKKDLKIIADLEIGFKSFREIYTSEVIYNNQDSKIEVTSINGNIKKLLNIWEFEEIDKNSCNVIFFIDIELKNPIINILFNKFFNYGFEKILNSFEQRAKETIKS
ncbi:MAG: type II toxin-antitoxin system RatA family toxin [Alphaproteobacteria bacterium]|nr:type II toxin-antitoxin system RatA family toxin [Alphaproteobacteria bacterium]